jgi:tol-pal system protein YbgF
VNKRLLLPLLSVLLGACATVPEGPDPVQLKLDELDARVARIDRVLDNQSLMQLAQQVEALQAQLRLLNGRIEELQNDNAALRKQQRDLYADLEGRLAELKSAVPREAPAMQAPVAGAPTGSDEEALYASAFDLLKRGDYAGAVVAFRVLAQAHPQGKLADNTQYWLGEAHYVMRDYVQAAAAFERVVAQWPESRKAPDALLKLGYSQLEQRQMAAGRATLQQVVARHPGSDAARLAAERLQKLPANGR